MLPALGARLASFNAPLGFRTTTVYDNANIVNANPHSKSLTMISQRTDSPQWSRSLFSIACSRLDEFTTPADATLGRSILSLISQSVDAAPASNRHLIVRTKEEIGDESLRANLLELIETIIFYKLPRLGREETQAMLQVSDIRETRVYEEGVEEGVEKGIEKGVEKGIETERYQSIANMAALKMPAEDIARILGRRNELRPLVCRF